MLTRIKIQGFSSFENTTADLGPMNVLIGPNGAGKSNLIKFLRMNRFVLPVTEEMVRRRNIVPWIGPDRKRAPSQMTS